jgi:hypothetical protein
MGDFWLATGVLFIPFGFWLMVEYSQNKMVGAIAVILGANFVGSQHGG